MPAIDAGEHAITSTYYVDNQVATQKQNEETVNYTYDPMGRPMETVSEGKTSSKAISHYAGPGSTLSWMSEGSEKWTRNISGIDGALDAIQTSGGAAVLQLHDLEGNIVATAALSESETKLLSTYNSTEFGVPQPGTTPPKYAWLGAGGVSSEPSFGSGASIQGGPSYVPEIGRPLQTESVAPPGAFPDGTGGAGIVGAPYLGAENGQLKAIAVQHEAELEEAKKREAEEIAELSACTGSCAYYGPGNPEPNEGGAEEEGESIVGYLPFEHGGGGAHAADHIECEVAEGNGLPHASSHNLGFVNWTIKFKCNAPVLDVRVRLALFREGEKVSETGYVEVGTTAYFKESVQTPCVPGWYTGWVYVDLVPPPGYEGDRVFTSWSKSRRYVDCEL